MADEQNNIGAGSRWNAHSTRIVQQTWNNMNRIITRIAGALRRGTSAPSGTPVYSAAARDNTSRRPHNRNAPSERVGIYRVKYTSGARLNEQRSLYLLNGMPPLANVRSAEHRSRTNLISLYSARHARRLLDREPNRLLEFNRNIAHRNRTACQVYQVVHLIAVFVRTGCSNAMPQTWTVPQVGTFCRCCL